MPIRSSASKPSTEYIGIESDSRILRQSSICGRRSSGMARRPCLYSAYSWLRNVGLGRSNAAIAYSGRLVSTSASIEVNPYAALVTAPPRVLMGGSAKKAR